MGLTPLPLLPDRIEANIAPCCADEAWAAHPTLEGFEISTCGRVWSVPRWAPWPYGVRRAGGKLLAVTFRAGTWRASTKIGGCRQTQGMNVARLVMELFSGESCDDREPLLEDLAAGPHLYNMRWGSHSESLLQGISRGTVLVGEKRYNSKLSDAQAARIRELLRTPMLQKDIAVAMGVSRKLVNNIKMGKCHKHPQFENPGVTVT